MEKNTIITDVRSIDRTKLRDINSVVIDPKLPKAEKIQSFVSQIGNPYCYMDGDVVVSLGFSNTGTCLKDQLKALAANIG